uniref:Putative secreted protein n=1 Tax=Anopheles darlingi TaxID=43151 RepID=A0A2M4DG68_ANODA
MKVVGIGRRWLSTSTVAVRWYATVAGLGCSRSRCRYRQLTGSLLLVLDKVVKQARPGLGVVVVLDITGFYKVQKHIPRVLRHAPYVLVLLQKVQPALQDVGCVHGKHEPPQADGHIE